MDVSLNKTYESYFIKIIEYLFVLFTILQGNSIYFCHSKLIVILIWIILLLILFIRSILLSNNYESFYLFVGLFIISSIILFIYYLYHPFSIIYFLILSLDPSLLVGFLYSNFVRTGISFKLFYYFEHIIYLLALISLICYSIYSISRYTGNFYMTYQWGGGEARVPGYFGLYFFSAIGYNFMGVHFPLRNTGIFTEAPVFSYLLSIGLFINIFLINKRQYKDNLRFIILLISIFLTFSTNGIILSILSIVFKNIDTNSNNIKKYIYILCIPLFLIASKIIFDSKKDLGTLNANSSYNVRHEDVLASLYAWTKHIIFGNGIGNNFPIYNKYFNYQRFLPGGDTGVTTDLFAVLAYGGIFIALFYIVPTILSFFLSRNIRNLAVFSFMYFMVEGVMAYFIYIIILSFFVSCYLYEKENKLRTYNKFISHY